MKLVFRSGPRSDEEIEIDRDLVLGREDADIEIEDSAVSRRHALLRPVEGTLEIEDLGSTNGTYVNGMKIDSPTTLQPGDFVNIGQSTLEIGGVDWRSAETQALSIPAVTPDGADQREDYVPTAPIAIEDGGSGGPLSRIPKVWLFAGAGVILILLLSLAVASFTGGGPSRREVLNEADAICRKAQAAKVKLAPGQKLAQLKRGAGQLLEPRVSVLADLRKVESTDELKQPLAAFFERYEATNDRLRFVQSLGAKEKKGPVQRAVDAVGDAARAETKAAKDAGLRVCGGLPI